MQRKMIPAINSAMCIGIYHIARVLQASKLVIGKKQTNIFM
jgi:hypothetical protein